MRKGIGSAALLWMLAGCQWVQPASPPKPKPTPAPQSTPAPTPWLTQDPLCTGTLTRAEWLVCDDKNLNALHRRLAGIWANERQNASDQRLTVLEDQLYALLSERDACTDAACVGTAYRRYLYPAIAVAPPPAPRPPVKPRPKPKPKPRPHGGKGQGSDYWYKGAGEQSCTGEIGGAAAARLASQCEAVTGASGGQCSARRPCGELRYQIRQGCWGRPGNPGACGR